MTINEFDEMEQEMKDIKKVMICYNQATQNILTTLEALTKRIEAVERQLNERR